MRERDFRRILQGTAFIGTIAMAGSAVPRAVVAQTPNDPQATAPRTGTNYDDNDTDWGWVGLLGLAGLLGLRRRDRHVDHVDTTRRP